QRRSPPVRVDGADLDREAARPKALAPCGAVETVTRGDPDNKKRDPPAFPSTGPLSPHRALAFRLAQPRFGLAPQPLRSEEMRATCQRRPREKRRDRGVAQVSRVTGAS